MNNLVSKSPVLRFKLGKIIKALYGLDSHIIRGGQVNGLPVAYVNIPGKGYLAVDNKGNAYTYDEEQRQRGRVKLISNSFRPVKLTNYDRQHIYKASTTDNGMISYAPGYVRSISEYWAKQSVPKTVTPLIKKETPVNDNPEIITNPTVKANSETIVKSPQTKTPVTNKSMFLSKMGGWNRSMGNTISDIESQNMLKELGWSGNAEEILKLLNQNNIGGYYVKEDNKWGNLSRSALKAYYNRWKAELQINPPTDSVAIAQEEAYLSLKPSNLPTAFPKVEMPYTSTGTYDLGQSRILKDLGIRDYSSLVNYVNTNPGSSISSDLTLRFGNTSNWNQLNIENEIGIRGHYGKMNRNSLWGYLGGLKLNFNNNYALKLGWMLVRKQGGQLVSKSPVKRFKSNFR